MKKEINSIQYLRAIAVIMVVFVHATDQVDWLKDIFTSKVGYGGVDLFFVISGFIMVYSTHGRIITPRKFIWLRILRVVPLYWLLTIALVVIAFLAPSLVRSISLDGWHLASSLFFIPQLSPAFPNSFWPVLIPGWTLNYEMAFYSLFAVALFFSDNLRLVFLTVVMVGLVLLGLDSEKGTLFSFYSDLIILEFLLGAILGYLCVHGYLKKNNTLGCFILLAAIFMWWYLQDFDLGHRFFYAGLPAFFVVLAALMIDLSSVREFKLLHLIGNASYSIYLSHVFALGFLRAVWNKMSYSSYQGDVYLGLMLILIAIIFSVLVGVVVYELLEKKINLKLRRKVH